MALRMKLSCLWIFGLCLAASKAPQVPSVTDPHFIQQCVESHNEFRGKVRPSAADMKYMSWDDSLAQVAKAWAKKCKFEHNSCLKIPYQCYQGFEHVGENIWLGGFREFVPKHAVAKWYNESQLFDFDNLSCSGVCGHYTQVVWANSYKVGCAVTICPNFGGSSYAIFVCNYGPGIDTWREIKRILDILNRRNKAECKEANTARDYEEEYKKKEKNTERTLEICKGYALHTQHIPVVLCL
ncbi:GLIPR1-like protein 1 [Erethizon dorsatum]